MLSLNGSRDQGHIQWEREIITPMAGTGKLFALPVTNWWSQIKTAGAAIYANRHYLGTYCEVLYYVLQTKHLLGVL